MNVLWWGQILASLGNQLGVLGGKCVAWRVRGNGALNISENPRLKLGCEVVVGRDVGALN